MVKNYWQVWLIGQPNKDLDDPLDYWQPIEQRIRKELFKNE